MNFQDAHIKQAHNGKEGLFLTCDQLQHMAEYGISNIIQIPFPYYGAGGGFLRPSDRDWLFIALRFFPEEANLYDEDRKTVRELCVYVLQQRREGNKFFRIMRSVEGKLLRGGVTPEKVDLDFDRYPYQTELRLYAEVRSHTAEGDVPVRLVLPISWDEKLRLELDYHHEIRSEEAIRLFWISGHESNSLLHNVAAELSEEKLDHVTPETLVLEMKPVYATFAVPEASANSTSNQVQGDNRHWWEIRTSLDELLGATKWLTPDHPYGGFSWKQMHEEDALHEEWIELAPGVEAEIRTLEV